MRSFALVLLVGSSYQWFGILLSKFLTQVLVVLGKAKCREVSKDLLTHGISLFLPLFYVAQPHLSPGLMLHSMQSLPTRHTTTTSRMPIFRTSSTSGSSVPLGVFTLSILQ